MAITSSAKKAHRVSLRRRAFNLQRKKAVLKAVKEVKKLLAEKEKKTAAEAKTILAKAYQAIDKAAKRNIFNKAAAARKKSRLAKLIQKMK